MAVEVHQNKEISGGGKKESVLLSVAKERIFINIQEREREECCLVKL